MRSNLPNAQSASPLASHSCAVLLVLAAEEAVRAPGPIQFVPVWNTAEVVPAELRARQPVVARQRAGDRLDARVADPERVVDRRARVDLAVVGEDQQVRPAGAVLRPQVLDHGRQRRLHARAVELAVPEVDVGLLEDVGRLARSAKSLGRGSLDRQPEVEPELAAGRQVERPQECGAA